MGYGLGTEHRRYKVACTTTKTNADSPPMRNMEGGAISSDQEWFRNAGGAKVVPVAVFYNLSRQGYKMRCYSYE